MAIDYQRERVYRWENKHVMPYDKSSVLRDNAQSVIDHIWSGMGLSHPPKVEPLRKGRKAWATGSRLTISLPEKVPTWVIIHELAHAMTGDIDYAIGEGGECDHHGPDFVGVYIKLLDRFLNISMWKLAHTLRESKVDVNIHALPIVGR